MRSSAQEISSLLHAWCDGDRTALDSLTPLVYEELHRLAHRYMLDERGNHTLQTTALVNEAFLRLIDSREIEWKDRNHFFAMSANLMRHILVDFARSRRSRKRSGNLKEVSLDAAMLDSPGPDPDIARLDDALNALSSFDSRKAKVVELRFFGGLSVEETADVLGVSADTIKRDWRLAKDWLLREMKGQGKDEA
ncbi:MAG TPA: ECF-type sigma factor [Acidobacteriota bacterium]|nr:ECF-type sigma factor [Acidobacteriota bacterium]